MQWVKKHKIISIIIALFVLAAIGGAAGGNKGTINDNQASNPPTQATTSKTSKPSTSSPQSTPTAATKAPQVLLDQSGSGQAQTQPFTTGKSWTVTYTFDCSSFGSSGNFQLFVKNVDGSDNFDTGANDLAASGGNTDYFYDAGQHYLTVNSECSWHITVKG
jgi:hypothetical protein